MRTAAEGLQDGIVVHAHRLERGLCGSAPSAALRQKKAIWILHHARSAISLADELAMGSDSIFILRTQRYRTARGQYWHVAEAGVRVEMMKIESDPNFLLENRFKQRNPQWPVVAVAEPFQSTVQLPFPKNGASVTGISSPTLDRRVPHPGSARRT